MGDLLRGEVFIALSQKFCIIPAGLPASVFGIGGPGFYIFNLHFCYRNLGGHVVIFCSLGIDISLCLRLVLIFG